MAVASPSICKRLGTLISPRQHVLPQHVNRDSPMKLLDRHIIRELIGPFIFGVAAFTSLMFAGKELFRITELVAEYHASLLTAGRLVALHLPSLIVLTLPMAMLLSALLGFGRLSSDSETVALFAGGISFYRIAVPVIFMSIIVTAVSFWMSEAIAPRATAEHERIFRELKAEPLSSEKPFMVIDANDGVTNSVFYVQHGFDAAKNTLRDVAMIRYVDNKPAIFIFARKAVWKGSSEWSFQDGYWKSISSESANGRANLTMFFKESKTIKINRTPDELVLYQKTPGELSFSELRQYICMLQKENADVREYRVRLYQKIALPLASLVFALVGAPLGLRPHRTSSAMGLGLAIVIIFAYWILMHYMTILGRNGTVAPATASFTPTLVGVLVGMALIARAAK